MNWFRLYSEARNDAKLRTLTDPEHRVWFNLLCYAAEQKPERGEIRDYDMDLLAIEVAGGDSDLLFETLKKLSRLRIVHATASSHISFLKFEARQYDKPSDRPSRVKERVQAHRGHTENDVQEPSNEGVSNEDETPCNAMKRDETPCNAMKRDETPILREYSENTQNREESPQPPEGEDVEVDDVANAEDAENGEKDFPKHLPEQFLACYSAYPKHEKRRDALKAWDSVKPSEVVCVEIEAFIGLAVRTRRWREGYAPAFGPFLRGQRWKDDLADYDKGGNSASADRASPHCAAEEPPRKRLYYVPPEFEPPSAEIGRPRGLAA